MNTKTKDHAQERANATMVRPAPSNNLPAESKKAKHPVVAFKEYMDERMETLRNALPPYISEKLFASVVMSAMQRKPELMKCTKQSLWNACILAAQDGLLPDGREGAIVPYGENIDGKRAAEIATWMPMVEGFRKKARNSGEIAAWEVNLVRARDKFHVTLGDDAAILHEPYFGADDPGAVVGAYSIATLRDGTKMRDVMTIREISQIRSKSRAKNGPWGDPIFFPEMCRKTMARRHYKQLPKSSELDKMIERDDRAFGLDNDEADQVEQHRAQRIGSVSAAFDRFADGPTIDHGAADDAADNFADDAPPIAEDNAGAVQEEKPAEAAKPEQEVADHAGIDEDARQWPLDQMPNNEDDYQFFAETKIETFKNIAEIETWWRSDEQRKLRADCDVKKATFDQIVAFGKAHANKLRGSKNGTEK